MLPHWNWQGHEGQAIPVMVYSNAQEVELLLNGRSRPPETFTTNITLPVASNVSSGRELQSKYRLPRRREQIWHRGDRHQLAALDRPTGKNGRMFPNARETYCSFSPTGAT